MPDPRIRICIETTANPKHFPETVMLVVFSSVSPEKEKKIAQIS
jgi:hypothetical protein